MRLIDIIDVKAAVAAGHLITIVRENNILLQDTKSGECVKIGDAPTIDAALVVRCIKCRFGQEDDAGVMHCHKHHIHKKSDGYCDDGEMKEG